MIRTKVEERLLNLEEARGLLNHEGLKWDVLEAEYLKVRNAIQLTNPEWLLQHDRIEQGRCPFCGSTRDRNGCSLQCAESQEMVNLDLEVDDE